MPENISDKLKPYARPFPLSGEHPDIAPIIDIAGHAEAVALGEPTHGQREINTLRHRLSALLIENLGFTTVALEAPASRCVIANDWIHGRGGDPDDIPVDLGYWMYATDEYRLFLNWLRHANMSRPHDRRISIIGIDVEDTQAMSWSERDRAMAENVLGSVEAGQKVIVWAHNGHITKDTGWLWDPTQTPMGTIIASRLDERYVAIGSAFGEGEFLAYQIRDGEPPAMTGIQVSTPIEGSLDAILAGLGTGDATMLDLRRLPPALRDLLDQPLASRSAGAVVEEHDEHYALLNAVRCFDALGFVRHATASRVIKRS